jgi:chromosome segregation ATPase
MATTLKSSSSTSSDSSSKTLTDASYHLSELQDSLDSFEPFTTLTLTSPYKSSSELQDRVNVLEKQNLALRLALAKERSSNATLKEKAERRSRAFAELDARMTRYENEWADYEQKLTLQVSSGLSGRMLAKTRWSPYEIYSLWR